MDARKRHYLAAMDIPLYVRRDAPEILLTEAPSPAPKEGRSASVKRDSEPESRIADPLPQPEGGNRRSASVKRDPEPDLPSPEPASPSPSGSGTPDRDSFSTWEPLEEAVRECRLCTLCETRTNTVFGVGDRAASWMIIGEAPGADEDAQGEPFVGRGGRLLTAMLEAAGAPRDRVFIANVLKCRPPGNRDPKPEEADACSAYLDAQVALVKPKLIIAVGRIAAQRLLATDTPIGKLRGTVHQYGDTGIPLVATYHPAYLLRSPGQKRRAWDDMKLALSVVAPDVRSP